MARVKSTPDRDFVGSAIDQVKEQNDEVERAKANERKDAARYRFLRDALLKKSKPIHFYSLSTTLGFLRGLETPEEVDHAVDKEMP
jgi:hypothetical protein